MKYCLYFLFSFVMAQPLVVPPADTMNALFITIFDSADINAVRLLDDTHLILELSQRDPESFYKYEQWYYEQNVQGQRLQRNGEDQILDEARLEWLQALLNEALSLRTSTPHFLNYDYFNDNNRWFFASDDNSFVSIAFWQENTLLQSWYMDPKLDGIESYTQNDLRIILLLSRHFVAHQLLDPDFFPELAEEEQEYFTFSDDIARAYLLAVRTLDKNTAFKTWREVQPYLNP
jgi:hypothetical protein